LDKDYKDLFERYSKYTDEDLKKIISSGDDYTEEAKKVASDVLNSDRSLFYKEQEEKMRMIEEKEKIAATKYNNQQVNPLYDDIHQIANDLRFIKNLIIIGIVIGIIFGVIAFI